MDETTKRVKEMYERYPFPSSNLINVAYGRRILRDLNKRKLNTHKLRLLDAGCGSGEKVISLAKVFPDSEVFGWDICQNSLERARELAKVEKVKNVKFLSMNLLNVDLASFKDYFDVIVSWGVIHHLSDTVKGLENLGKCLKPSGLIYVWVYALHSLGRTETKLFREAIRILLKNEDFTYEKGIKIIHAIKGQLKTLNYSLTRDFLMRIKWFMDKDVDKKEIILNILKNFHKIKHTSNYEVNIVDAFLHANEKDYDVDMIFNEAEEAGLEILDFPDLPQDIEKIVDSDYVKDLFYKLDLRDRLKVMERITDAGHHLFIARKK